MHALQSEPADRAKQHGYSREPWFVMIYASTLDKAPGQALLASEANLTLQSFFWAGIVLNSWSSHMTSNGMLGMQLIWLSYAEQNHNPSGVPYVLKLTAGRFESQDWSLIWIVNRSTRHIIMHHMALNLPLFIGSINLLDELDKRKHVLTTTSVRRSSRRTVEFS